MDAFANLRTNRPSPRCLSCCRCRRKRRCLHSQASKSCRVPKRTVARDARRHRRESLLLLGFCFVGTLSKNDSAPASIGSKWSQHEIQQHRLFDPGIDAPAISPVQRRECGLCRILDGCKIACCVGIFEQTAVRKCGADGVLTVRCCAVHGVLTGCNLGQRPAHVDDRRRGDAGSLKARRDDG